MKPGKGEGRPPTSGWPHSHPLHHRGVRILVGLALAAWGLVAWMTLAPPVEIPLPPLGVADMVWCEGGMLLRDGPTGETLVAPFFLDRFEVTAEDYAGFLAANPGAGCPPDPTWNRLRHPPPGAEELPMAFMTLVQAREYAGWRSKRLPTSDEWEWAARGPAGMRYPWGGYEPLSVLANTLEARFGGRTPVGLFESGKSSVGAYDLVGNLAEWTDSRTPGPFSDRYYVRGGSYRDRILDRTTLTTIMDTHRFDQESGWQLIPERVAGPTSFSQDRGFRCALDAAEVEQRRRINRLISRLGARDPVRYLRETWPARRALRQIGPAALPALQHAAEKVEHAGMRQRLLGLMDDLRDQSEEGDG